MDKTEWMITENYWDYKVDNVLFTYNENEIEQNKINKNNAWLLFTPKFIPFYPRLLEMWLTINESLVFWFIDFYLQNSSDKFYFTNEQIWKLFWFWEQNTSLIIKKLKEKWFIDTSYRLKANWWKIRFIKNLYSDYKNFYSPTIKKFIDNNNKINNNNINIYENQNLENQNQEQSQEINNSIPKQNNITPNLANGDLTFENIYKLFYHKSWHKPSIDKCRKVFDSLNLDTEWYNMLVKDLNLFRIEYKYWIKDQMYRPWFEKYVGWFNAEWVNEEYRLRTIIKFHMENREDIEKMKKRYKDLCDTFWKDTIDKLVKEYGRAKNKITLNIN